MCTGSLAIEFNGYDNKPIFIIGDKIVAFHAHPHSENVSIIHVSAGSGVKEWLVREVINDIRLKVDYA